MPRVIGLACVLACLVSACTFATADRIGAFKPAEPPASGMARVYVYRLNEPAFGQAGLYVNEVPLALLPKRTYHTFTAAPGDYYIRMLPYGMDRYYNQLSLWVHFDSDQEYYIEIDQTGTIFGMYLRTRDEAMVELPLTELVTGTQGIPPAMPLGDRKLAPRKGGA